MADSEADIGAQIAGIEELSSTDLYEACTRARKLVAGNPYDEASAELLDRLMSRFAASAPPSPDRLAGLSAELREVANLLNAEKDEEAEILLRSYLAENQDDVRAMAMMAEIASRCELYDDAQRILMRALELDPRSIDVLLGLAKLLNHRSFVEGRSEDRGREALSFLDQALEVEPDNVKVVSLYSSILVRFRRLNESIPWYERLTTLDPMNWLAWTNYGLMLKSLGKFGEAVAAYRAATAVSPEVGLAWWELGNLKLSRYFDFDVSKMHAMLGDERVDIRSRAHLHFALARAYDQRKDYAEAAEQLELGNALKRDIEPYDPEGQARDIDASIRVFTQPFIESRRIYGDPHKDPIFIVGMQRSGTTLVEQILSSHSQIEGTEELGILLQLIKEMGARFPDLAWQDALASQPPIEIRGMGEGVFRLARQFRVENSPFFIDKNPTNWRVTGLILTIVPNARIIDVRRNPMDCCFANWSQHYENGLGFSYGLDTLGRYYADYVRLMRHFSEVVPGRIHRVIYDDLVDDFETNARAIFDYLRLPFEESCLRFFETERVVMTPSAQQVRQPINRSGLGRSERYAPYLGELREALGDTLTNWRS